VLGKAKRRIRPILPSAQDLRSLHSMRRRQQVSLEQKFRHKQRNPSRHRERVRKRVVTSTPTYKGAAKTVANSEGAARRFARRRKGGQMVERWQSIRASRAVLLADCSSEAHKTGGDRAMDDPTPRPRGARRIWGEAIPPARRGRSAGQGVDILANNVSKLASVQRRGSVESMPAVVSHSCCWQRW